jgi:hypothetical protein
LTRKSFSEYCSSALYILRNLTNDVNKQNLKEISYLPIHIYSTKHCGKIISGSSVLNDFSILTERQKEKEKEDVVFMCVVKLQVT